MALEEITHEEYVALNKEGNFEFEGYITNVIDGKPTREYAHVKNEVVNGIRVTMWAEEDHEKSMFCTSPESVKRYTVTIEDYDDADLGISFSIPLDNRENIMDEFNSIVNNVKERMSPWYFELNYGELTQVQWGRVADGSIRYAEIKHKDGVVIWAYSKVGTLLRDLRDVYRDKPLQIRPVGEEQARQAKYWSDEKHLKWMQKPEQDQAYNLGHIVKKAG